MRNVEQWQASKYVYRNGKLRASSNPVEVSISSRLVTDLIAKAVETYIPTYAKGKLLDLGCGKVPLYEVYKGCVDEIVCVDWEKSLHTNPHVDFIADLNKKLDLEDEQFDTIILSDVLEHIYEPRQLWGEINRVLKKEGVLLLTVPFLYRLHEQPYDFFRYTRYALQAMAEENGFRVIFVGPYGGAVEVLIDIISKLIVGVPIVGKILAKLIQGAAFVLLGNRARKQLLSSGKTAFPLGYFLIAEKLGEHGAPVSGT